MNTKKCAQCKYYLQHYTFDKGKLFRVFCGHCTFSKPRKKLPDAVACKDFVAGLSKEDDFATKEYLSKELLQHILKMELLPEIKDLPSEHIG